MQSRHSFPERLGSFAIRFRIIIPVVFAALVVTSILLAGRISIVFQATDILNPETATAREFTGITETFGSTATIVVAVEGDDVAEMERAAHAVTAGIRESDEMMRYLRSVDLGVPTEYILRWGMTLLPPEQIEHLSALLSREGLMPFLVQLNDTLEEQMFAGDVDLAGNTGEWVGVELLGRLEAFVTTLRAASTGEIGAEDSGRALVEAFVVGDRFTYTPEKDMLLLYLQPSFPIHDIAATQTIMTLLEELTRDIEAEHGARIGMGGGVPQNRIQYDALRRDMTVPTIFALVIIVLLFLASFERVRNTLLAVVALIVGIILTVGVISLTVGQITIVTSVFAIVLVGLGVDFGIHLVTNFDDFRARGEPPPDAIRHSMRSSGGPIILGGLATAAVFFAVMTSGSPAIREFGFVGGIGILLTLASMMLLLPALLLDFGTGPRATPSRLHVLRYDFLRRIGRGVERARVWVIAAVAIVTVILAAHIPTNRISYDIFAMGPTAGPTMGTQRRIIEGMGVSPFIALALLDSMEEARDLSHRLRSDSFVAMTTSVTDLLPPEDEIGERLDAIRTMMVPATRTDAELRPIPFTTADVTALAEEIQRLEWNVIEAADLSAAAIGPGNRIVRRRDTMIREIIGAETGAPGREVFQQLIATLETDPERAARNLSEIDRAFGLALRDQAHRMSVSRAPVLDDIPPEIRAQFVDPGSSRFLVQIIPTAAVQADDESVLAFDRRMTALHPGITGTLRLYVSLVDELFGDGRIAALYGGATVLALMFLIFRSIRRVALAFGVVLMSIVWMFGLLAVFRIPLVMTGALALPLILGIGMAYALHILHRYEHERGSIEDTLRYSGKAVFLSSATTGIGFGSLGVLGTIGLASGLGYLLLVGIACCLVGSMIALPAFLATFGSRVTPREHDITASEDGET